MDSKEVEELLKRFKDLKFASHKSHASQASQCIYHYTDYWGYQGIKQDMRIKSFARDTKHARMGIGVYFTGLPPETSTDTILQRCYFHTGFQNKADYYVKIKTSDINSVKHPSRNIYCVKGAEGIDLSIVPHEFGSRIQNSLAMSRQLSYGSLFL